MTIGLLIMVYKGKNWAKIVSIILFSLALLGALVGLGTLDTPFMNKIPLLVMIFVYSMAIYHFGFAKSFKEFFKFQNIESTESIQDSKEIMESKKFWKIIENTKSESSGDYEKQQSLLERELLKLTAKEVLEFDNKFRTLRGKIYTWDFWAAAYIINGGCSDDCFSDFRGWLIGQGKSIFESAVQNIETLSELKETNDGDWEGLSYISTDIYEKKTGNDMPNEIQENFEIIGEEWAEDENELKNRFPKLYAKFGME
ncbi:DUF4240 domain-containing protein [Tenacibaculum finnmarkense]|uniref:DUF4240 domain-containing protein n=1 Tax=Tenacibaculum finnmarkense TaxID=2781243 RepID=UPI001E2DA3CF|nr:DUF4240 domain-containing protein [Tenacibaculum finnmarkense]MCD8413587.1 DUF4240 domain-containing protein [Tenacibaculum finnmarkense genomovar ulcerans]MCG8208474.1 DUF4240 domain-containing protein [Tenacibaculum finnmarkense genomovar finnmarkense]MCG8742743.1 DUF4240 domain-containing protein [Tenacibaculum finnmarkense]MCM8907640.1 DUF4240 domain-containing protein [Tenacibaculum finnmarkense genomovar finnmarkense]